MAAEFVHYLLVGVFAFGNITIPAKQFCLRKSQLGFFLQFLGSHAKIFNPAAFAVRAGEGIGIMPAALMANQIFLVRVVSKQCITAFAHGYIAAVTALDKTGTAPPVYEKDGLLMFCQYFFNRSMQVAGENTPVAFGKFGAHIYQLGFGQGSTSVGGQAFGQFQQLVKAVLGFKIAVNIRGGTAQHQNCTIFFSHF